MGDRADTVVPKSLSIRYRQFRDRIGELSEEHTKETMKIIKQLEGEKTKLECQNAALEKKKKELERSVEELKEEKKEVEATVSKNFKEMKSEETAIREKMRNWRRKMTEIRDSLNMTDSDDDEVRG